MNRRDLWWGALFVFVGFVLLGMVPIENPLGFLVVGWTALIVGAGLLCRCLVDRVAP